MTLAVYLESNHVGRTMAHVPALPGCIARGRTQRLALARIGDAVAQNAEWLRAHGTRIRALENFTDAVAVPGGAASGSGSRVALLPTDTQRVSESERREHLRHMAFSRDDFLALASRVPAKEKQVRGRRTVREILQHVAGAEQWYLTRLCKLPRFPVQKTPFDRLRIVRKKAFEVLSNFELRKSARVILKSGEPWTFRKALRRFLEHEREHTLELENRLLEVGLPFSPEWMDAAGRRRERRLIYAFAFK